MTDHTVSLAQLTGRFPHWLIWHGRSTGLWSALPPRDLPALRLIQSASLDDLATRIAHALSGRTLQAPPVGASATWRLDEDSWPVRAGRRAVADALDAWRLGRWRDDALTVTSELVTNAVSHGSPPITLTLAVTTNGHGAVPELLVEVTDGSPDPPVRRPPGDDGGFGLTVINAYADVTVTPHRGGKAVRARLPEPPAA
ncbi:ATP-binding protein [Spirillospora sp. NPDC047279]|uniref:ATP-binding protein n=1 Tax=Spirillospora sp. NPDC047279 TaxID=3155478 RepID=UPI00340A7402